MKKVIVLFIAILAFTGYSFAQTDNQAAPITEKTEKHKGGGKHGKHAGMDMKKQLNLTAEQETQMKTIGGTYRGKMQAIKSDNTLNKDQKKAKFEEMQKSHDSEIKGVLNGEQYVKFTELKKQRRDNMKNRKSPKVGKVQKSQE